MTDRSGKQLRSWNMSQIKGKDTVPELVTRRLLHKLGFRYCLHRKDLLGRPDITLPKYKTVIFVHGCFWHRHPGCKYAYKPKSNINFWEEKFEKNIKRDTEITRKLEISGWKVLIIWECQTKILENLKQIIESNLK
jgi:DNA mismatch endonuclease (patch repair protein)